MNEVLLLQNQIAVLEQEIIELNAERNGLIGFQIENINALDEVEMQVKRRYKVADKFSQLKRVSTFATKLADKYAEHYGQTKGGALVYQYNEIDRNISKAIMQVDIEIKDKKCEIYRLENGE